MFNVYNNCVLMGNLVRPISIKELDGGHKVGNTSIVINERVKRGDEWENEATFVDCTFWGKVAEHVEKFGKQGAVILVEGRLKTERWTKEGKAYSKLKLITNRVVFVSRTDSDKGRKRGGDEEKAPVDDMPYATDVEGEDGVPF